MPSVAHTRTFGSRVASRTAATRGLGPLGHEPRRGARDEGERGDREAGERGQGDDPVDSRRGDVRLRQEAVERDREDRGGGEREPDHAADRLHRADEGHHEDGELVEGEAGPAAPQGEDARGDEREQPEERGRRARARPLPLAEDRRERGVDEHQVVVGDELRPVRRGEHAEGERTTSASGIHARRACANELDEPEQHREDRAEDDGAVEVRPEDEQRQDEQRAPAGRRGATRRRAARARRRRAGARPSARATSSPTGRRGSRGSR